MKSTLSVKSAHTQNKQVIMLNNVTKNISLWYEQILLANGTGSGT